MRIRRSLLLAAVAAAGVLSLLAGPAEARPEGHATCKQYVLGDQPPPTGSNGLPKLIECYY